MRRWAERFLNLEPETIGPETPLTRVLQRLIETRYKSFPVVENGRFVGMIACEDIRRALRRAVAKKRFGSQ